MQPDYVSENLQAPKLDFLFPQMIVGDKEAVTWPYFRKEIGHTFLVDRRSPFVGFINRDEVAILFSNARLFAGRRGLEIGALRGWSSVYLLAAGLSSLHIVEPWLEDAEWRREFSGVLHCADRGDRAVLVPGASPEDVVKLGESGVRWAFAFIDGEHIGEAPKLDALGCERYLEPTAMIVFHDLVVPFVGAGLRALAERGWNTMAYQTAQMMGVAWRGDVTPVSHRPDPNQPWTVPDHLEGIPIASLS